FTTAGTYVLQLSANDTQLTSTSNVTVTVLPVNQAPVVSAGANQTITLPTNTVTLNGTVSDDGLPPPPTLAIQWSEQSGPAGVTFSSPSTAVTQATFPGAGTFVLKLSASDTQLTTSATVTVTVQTASTPPVAAFTSPGVPRPLLGTVIDASGGQLAQAAAVLDANLLTGWSTPGNANQFVKIQLSVTDEVLVDRVQLWTFGTGSTVIKDFDVQVSLDSADADFVTVASGTYQNDGTLQEFVFPGGPVRTRVFKLILKNNYGATSIGLSTLNVMAVGAVDSIVSLPADNNLARM